MKDIDYDELRRADERRRAEDKTYNIRSALETIVREIKDLTNLERARVLVAAATVYGCDIDSGWVPEGREATGG